MNLKFRNLRLTTACGKAFPWLASPQITSASADGRQVLHLNIEAVSSRKMEIKRRSVPPRAEEATMTLHPQ